jgi:putative PEP-CTERM system TPR-repeat lipoprotein
LGGAGYFALKDKTQVVAADDSYYGKAKNFIKIGYHSAALIQFKNALKEDPENSEIRIELGNLYLFLKDISAAEKEYRYALNINDRNSKAQIGIWKTYLLQNKFNEVIAEVDFEKLDKADHVMAYFVLGSAYQSVGDIDNALSFFIEGEKLDAKHTGLDIAIARLYKFQGKFTEALKKTDEALKINEDNLQALMLKAELLKLLDGPEAALPFFNRVLESQPQNMLVWVQKMSTLFELNRDLEAREELDIVFKTAPEYPLAHYYAAVHSARAGQFSDAVASLDKGGAGLEDYPPAVFLRGLLSYREKNYEQSAIFLDKTVKQNKRNLVAQRLYGVVLYELKEYQKTIDVLAPMTRSGNADATVFGMIASSYMALKNTAEGQKFYQFAIAASAGPSIFDTKLALTKLAKNDTAQAVFDLRTIISNHPNVKQATLYLTLLAHKEGKYEMALESIEKLIKLSPKDPVGYNLKGTVLSAIKKIDEAKKEFEKALKVKADFVPAKLNLASLEVKNKNFSAAQKIYEEVLKGDKNNTQALAGLSRISDATSDLKKSKNYMTKAIESNPKDITLRVSLLQIYLKQNRIENAKDVISAIIRDFPTSPVGYEALGNVNLSENKTADAVDNFKLMSKYMRGDEGAERLLALAYYRNKEVSKARDTLIKAVGTSRDKIKTLTQLINLEIAEKSFVDAHEYVGDYAKIDNYMVGSEVAKARVYLAEKKFDDALSHFKKAEEKGAKGTIFVNQFAGTYFLNKEHDKGREVLQAWLKINPNDAPTLHNLGSNYLQRGEYAKSRKVYKKLIAQNAEDIIALNNGAWLFSQNGELKMALSYSKKAFELVPSSPDIMDTYAWILMKTGHYKKALPLLKKASIKKPDSAEVRYHYGVALHKSGNISEAKSELEKSLSSGSNFTEIEDARALLRTLSN